MDIVLDRAADIKSDWAMKMLLFGASGSGKTFATALLDDVLQVVWEKQALITIRSVNPDALVYVVNDTGKRTKKEQIERVLLLLEHLKENDLPHVKTIVIDSLNEAYEVILGHEMDSRGSTRANFDDRNTTSYVLKNIVKQFRDLNKNVVFIALSKETQDDNSHIRIKAGLTDTLSDFVYKSVGIAGYLYTQQDDNGGIERLCRLEGPEEFRIKKHPALDSIERPHLQKWIAKIGAWVDGGKNMYSALDNNSPVVETKKEESKKLKPRLKKPAKTLQANA